MNIQDKFTLAVCALGIILCAVGLVGAWRMSKQHKAQNALAYELPDDAVPQPRNCAECLTTYELLMNELEKVRTESAKNALENIMLKGERDELLNAAMQQEIKVRDLTAHRDALDERLRRVYLDNAGAKQDGSVKGLPCSEL